MPSLYTFLCLLWLNRGSLKHYFMSVFTSPTVLGSTATEVCSARPAQSLWPRTTLPATVQQQDAPHHHCSANTKQKHTHTLIFNTGCSFYLILKLLLILFISCAQTHFTYCCTYRAARVFQPLPWRQFYFKVCIFFFPLAGHSFLEYLQKRLSYDGQLNTEVAYCDGGKVLGTQRLMS